METEYLIIGLVGLAVLTVGYTFFQAASQNTMFYNSSMVDTNNSTKENSQVNSSDRASNLDEGSSSIQGTSTSHRPRSDTENNLNPDTGDNEVGEPVIVEVID
ncbi:MAG: hypothetical protein H5T36_02580 [Methanobacteriaceae archaeon]|nr:hypothetical protein [Methanobacteriaceae archaeon]